MVLLLLVLLSLGLGGVHYWRVNSRRAAADAVVAAAHAAVVKELREAVLKLKSALGQDLRPSDFGPLRQEVSSGFAKHGKEFRSLPSFQRLETSADAAAFFWQLESQIAQSAGTDAPLDHPPSEEYLNMASHLGRTPRHWSYDDGAKSVELWTGPTFFRKLGFSRTADACDQLLQELQ
ncbi:MAG: hypothetical protein JWR69_164 [Pedosphaera sp.]|nr:hypothetical protein [Pedosphaera sp.]